MFTRDDVLVAAKKINLSKKGQEKLLKLIKNSDSGEEEVFNAREELKQQLKPLIISVVEKYTESAASLEELVRWGEIGLDSAIEKWNFKKERNYPFSYYAVWYIRAEIHDSLGLPTDVEGYDEIEEISND